MDCCADRHARNKKIMSGKKLFFPKFSPINQYHPSELIIIIKGRNNIETIMKTMPLEKRHKCNNVKNQCNRESKLMGKKKKNCKYPQRHHYRFSLGHFQHLQISTLKERRRFICIFESIHLGPVDFNNFYR